jgi:subtilisin family serine protease
MAPLAALCAGLAIAIVPAALAQQSTAPRAPAPSTSPLAVPPPVAGEGEPTPRPGSSAPPAPAAQLPVQRGYAPGASAPVPPVPGSAGAAPSPVRPGTAGATELTPAPVPSVQRSPGTPGPPAGSAAPALAPLAPPPGARNPEAADESPVEPGQLLLAFRSVDAAQAGFAELKSRYGVDAAESATFGRLGLVVGLVQLDGDDAAARLKQRIARDHPDWIVDFNTRLTPLAGPRHYALAQIGRAAGGGPGVRMGLLDTAVEAIPALAQARIAQQLFVEGAGPAANAHGTALAALLVGRDPASGFEGVAPGSELAVGAIVRRQGQRDDTTVALLLAGLDWLLSAEARVVNLSLGGPPNALMAAAIRAVTRQGVAVVAAAGNGGPRAPPAYPAAYPEVIAVTAIDAAGRVFERANRGDYVLIAAPGVDVWVPDAAAGRYVSGTSFAAAAVTGAVALLLARDALAPAQVRERLCAGARNLGDPGRDPVYGCGLLQVQAAAPAR